MPIIEISGVQKPVVRHARRTGWLTWKMKIEGIRGCPDHWFFKNGKLLIMEFKAPGKSRQKAQQLRANELLLQGFEVHVIDDADRGKELLDVWG